MPEHVLKQKKSKKAGEDNHKTQSVPRLRDIRSVALENSIGSSSPRCAPQTREKENNKLRGRTTTQFRQRGGGAVGGEKASLGEPEEKILFM